MRRNFKLTETDRVLIVEDAVTREAEYGSGRYTEINSIRTMLVACLVDRSTGDLDFQTSFNLFSR